MAEFNPYRAAGYEFFYTVGPFNDYYGVAVAEHALENAPGPRDGFNTVGIGMDKSLIRHAAALPGRKIIPFYEDERRTLNALANTEVTRGSFDKCGLSGSELALERENKGPLLQRKQFSQYNRGPFPRFGRTCAYQLPHGFTVADLTAPQKQMKSGGRCFRTARRCRSDIALSANRIKRCAATDRERQSRSGSTALVYDARREPWAPRAAPLPRGGQHLDGC